MFSREELYYQGQDVGDTYLDSPGILQVNRLLNQQPGIFLQSNAAVSVMHKRCVVINDWGDELENTKSLLYQYIALLLDESFVIYQIQGETLAPIPNLRALKAVPSDVLNERNVYKLLNDHKIEKDKVYLLSHDKIAKICGELTKRLHLKEYPLEGSFSQENKTCRKQFEDNYLKLDVERGQSFWCLLNKSRTRFALPKDVLKAVTSPSDSSTLSKVRNVNDNILISAFLEDITTLAFESLSPEKIKAMVLATPNVNTLICRWTKNISLDTFSHLPQLEKLVLVWSEHYSLSTPLPHLKWLIIDDQTIDAIDIEAILQNMPNLETLQLKSVTIRGEFQSLNVTSLKQLVITRGAMSSSLITTLVNQSPFLVSVKIACKYEDKENFDFIPKKSLRLLELAHMGISAKSLESLLSESLVHLELLDVWVQDKMTLSHPLNHLVRLKIDLSNFLQKMGEKLSDLAPCVQDLILIKNYYPHLALKFRNLQSIKTLAPVDIPTEEIIEALHEIHAFKLEADINMGSIYKPILYRQSRTTETPESILIISSMDKNTISIIKACPWIKTIIVCESGKIETFKRDITTNTKWVIANSISINTNEFEDWQNMEILWKSRMEVQIDTFQCKYEFNLHAPLVFTITGKITALNLEWLLQKLPKNEVFDLVLNKLKIHGSLKELHPIKVNTFFIKNMRLHYSALDLLMQRIQSNKVAFKRFGLKSVEEKSSCRVNTVAVDQQSYNANLFLVLKSDLLIWTTINPTIVIQRNDWVKHLKCEGLANQEALTEFNKAFMYLNHLELDRIALHDFEEPTTNRFNVEKLTFTSHVDIKSNSLLEFIKQFPKVKECVINKFTRTLLLDFKKYCPDLNKLTLIGNQGALLKPKDLAYLMNALPQDCEIILDNFQFTSSLETILAQYPQLEIKNYALNSKDKMSKGKKPPAPDFKAYDPTRSQLDPNWSQAMLINRLIAYKELLLPTEDSSSSLLKRGICSAVAKWFADTVEQKGLNAWNEQWQLIKSWNKQSLPPKESTLGIALEALKTYVSRYQLEEDTLGNLWDYLQSSQVITNDLNQFLKDFSKKPLFISNAWHKTCLMHKENQWIYFDPNYKHGKPQCFNTKEDVLKEITRVLGFGLSITSFNESLSSCWNTDQESIHLFLETGGFGLLITKQNEMKQLKDLPLSKAALEGLFLLNTNNIPFWYFGLTQDYSFFTGNPIQDKTLSLFVEYAKLTSDNHLISTIKKGMGYLDSEKRARLKTSLGKCEIVPYYVDAIMHCIAETPLPVHAKEASWLPDKVKIPKLKPRVESESLIAKKSVQLKKTALTQDHKSTKSSDLPNAVSPNVLRTITLNHPFLLNTALANYQKNPTEPLESSPFKTWVLAKNEGFQTLTQFDHFLAQHHSKNLLLHMPDDKQSLNYLHHLQASALCKARGLYVINSFEALHCAISTIKTDSSGKGIVQPPNSGPFYDFLIENTLKAPIIAVNWSNFTLPQLIQANTLLDKSRHVDKVNLPKEAIVLGLQNPNSANAYLGSDFSSRHFKISEFPHHLEMPKVVALPKLQDSSQAFQCVIDLYDENNWEAYLYGHWQLTEQGFFFKKSALLEALDSKPETLQLVLKNAPFHNPHFTFAFNSLVSQGYCTVNGSRFELPKQCGISLETGFDFKALFADTVISMERGYLSQEDLVLNPDSLPMFIENYRIYSETHALITLPGLLEKQANQTLSLCLTSSLTLGAYAKLLATAKQYNIHIKLKVAPHIDIPKEIQSFLNDNKPVPVIESLSSRVIVSNDLHCTEKMLQLDAPFGMSIDISEETKDSLLYALSGQLLGEKPQFKETISDVWQALLDKKRVLLKGHFSQSLIDALAMFLKPKGGIYHNGAWEISSGELVLLTDTADNFSFVSQVEQVHVSFETKMGLLGSEKTERLLKKYAKHALSDLSYAYLDALALAKPLPDKPHDLIKPLIQLPDLPEIDEDFGLEAFKSTAFKTLRVSDLLGALKYQPCVFVSGETGVGKSSCMHDLEKEPFISILFNDIEAWLKADASNQYNILFIDEANLIKTDWLSFEGLYSTPPSIFYKGSHYFLSANYKVVFAGNPASYSQERRLPALFQNHPNAVVFGAMNNAYLYHEVLKPILQDNEETARLFLKTFQMVKKISKDAISARELQMMAYLFQTQQLPENATEKAKTIAFTMACQVLPKEHVKSFETWFEHSFGLLKPAFEKMPLSVGKLSSKTQKKKIWLAPSLQTVYGWLNAFMDVRSIKQQGQDKASYGGLSGLVLEGEPGLGKSQLVKAFLVDRGFSEKIFNAEGTYAPFDYEAFKNTNPQGASHFYYLPAKLNIAVKIDMLNKAFHEGAVVLIDEVNASSLLEELMNALLMGEDLKGRRAIVPGFTLFCTQNPSSMAGRTQASLAWSRRVIHCDFTTYTPEEMVQVLMYKGLDVQTACSFVYEFLKDQYFARKHGLDPEPCFRDVLTHAKNHLKTGDLKIHASPIQLPFAETVLITLLDLDKPEHQDLIIHMRSKGYETFFYVSKDDEIHFLPHMQGTLKQNVLDNSPVQLVSHLQEKISSLSVRGNEALEEYLYAKNRFFSVETEKEQEKEVLSKSKRLI